MTAWTAFAGVTGGAAAGLTGLTFIVVAIRFDTIAVSEEFRNRAAQTLSLFVAVTVVAILITVPQKRWALGIEMLLIAIASATLLRFLDAAAMRVQTIRPRVTLQLGLAVFVGCIGTGGLIVLLGSEWGLYFYAVSAIVGLVSGVNGAWTFLTRAGVEPKTEVH